MTGKDFYESVAASTLLSNSLTSAFATWPSELGFRDVGRWQCGLLLHESHVGIDTIVVKGPALPNEVFA
jgi:hypothetical protein